MKIYQNSFVQGRELAKKLVIAVSISCILSLIASGYEKNVQFVFIALTLVLFVATIYVVAKYCRCPHCGRHIILGVLAVKICPGCRRSLITGKKVKKN